MPFNSENAAAAGRKGGPNRWRGKDPATNRNVAISIKVSKAEFDAINQKASDMRISRAELIVKAVEEYKAE